MTEPRTSARRRAVRRARRRRRALVLLVVAVALIVGASQLVSSVLSSTDVASAEPDERAATPVGTPTPPATSEPSATPEAPVQPAAPCDDAEVQSALDGDSDDAVIEAFGGGAEFRAAVAAGDAPCVDLHDAGRLWVVVNKRNALEPRDYWPTPQGRPQSTRIIAGGWLLERTASALDDLSTAMTDAGAGAIAVDSGFRPYDFQVETYARHVADRGAAEADLRSARPGHSEHQTGLAVDVVACGGSGCGDHDGFGGTPQSEWIVANAWRYGFVVRYEEGHTPTTGYTAEPWHLRYVGDELARAYAEGGFHTLEEFFGLDPAPDYG
ncbi:M15 family metallopeptidase [Microbacterium sp. 179-B 1A2 NHS]|uniref:M15 family metallopeptidase n=1 Tax=Microbacterium sp. 179-B 1A2 NHS TaxID=3142383 RepID=UPI0039A02127